MLELLYGMHCGGEDKCYGGPGSGCSLERYIGRYIHFLKIQKRSSCSYPLNPFYSQLTRNNSKSHAYRLYKIDGDVLLVIIQAMYVS